MCMCQVSEVDQVKISKMLLDDWRVDHLCIQTENKERKTEYKYDDDNGTRISELLWGLLKLNNALYLTTR